MVVKIGEITGNPFFIFDPSFKLLYSSIKIKKSKLLKEYNNSYILSTEFIYQLINNGDIDDVKKDEVIINKYKELKKQTMFRKIYVDENIVGYACSYCDEINKNDINLFNAICDTFARGFGILVNNNKKENNIFINILDEVYSSREEIETLLNNTGYVNKEEKYVALIHSTNKNLYIKNLLRDIDNISFVYNQYVVCITNKNKEEINDVYLKLTNTFKDKNIRIGISSQFKDITKLKSYYEEAVDALKIATEYVNNKQIVFIDDYRLLSLLTRIKPNELKKAIDPRVEKIFKYDFENNTNYLETINAYFDSGRNINKAANALYVHKNSMYYRLEKMKELFDFDFDSNNDCLLLELSLKLHNFIK